MKVISIINQKGGVGKSTTAQALASGLNRAGIKTLLVDLDAQGNLSYAMRATERALTSMEVLTGTASALEAIYKASSGDIIPSSPNLVGADTILTETGREYRLKEALEGVIGVYEAVVIDTPPNLGMLTINALTASTGAIIPTSADPYALQGVGRLYDTIQSVTRYTNGDLSIMGILLTKYSRRTVLSRDIAETLEGIADTMNTKVYESKVREAVAVREAQAVREDLYSYAPKATATEDYEAFIKEVLGQMGGSYDEEEL